MSTDCHADANPTYTKRQLQAMQTKDKIYNAAVQEINRKGFNNVSIEDITTAAKVAKGTFYTHFPTKEAVVFYTYAQSDAIYRQAFERVRGCSFLFAVTNFVHISYAQYELRGKGIIKAVISNYFTQPDHSFYGKDRALLQCLTLLVESGKREGSLDMSTPTQVFVDTLLATLIGVEVMWCFDDTDQHLCAMIHTAIELTARGMLLPHAI